MTETQLALIMPTDQVDPDATARALVRDAIHVTAALHSGYVSANDVRLRLIGADIPSHIPGQVFSALRREGHLIEAGVERSTDGRSGNSGRLIPTYRWVERP